MAITFRKLHKRYPLTKFEAYLRDKLGPTTVPHVVSAMRQILGYVEDHAGRRPDQWGQNPPPNDLFGFVEAFYASLSRRQQRSVQFAWAYWLGYTGALLPRLAAGREFGPRDHLAAAFRILVLGPAFAQSGYQIVDIRKFVWRYSASIERWSVVAPECRKRQGIHTLWTAPKFQPVLDYLREWAYPAPGRCLEDAIFLPTFPHACSPMPVETMYRLKDYRFYNTDKYEETFQRLMQEAEQKANAALILKPEFH
jgi:hypothetical protein